MNLSIEKKVPRSIAEIILSMDPEQYHFMNYINKPITMTENTTNTTEPLFSFFKDGIATEKGKHPYGNGTLSTVLSWMNSPKMIQLTKQLRALPDEDAQKAFKREKLPFVTFSGIFTQRSNQHLVQHPSLICFDIDELLSLEEILSVKQILLHDPLHPTHLLFTSPRGNGVKWVTSINLNEGTHRDWYQRISNHLYLSYGILVDPSPSNPVSACFLCHDPLVICNPITNKL